MFGSLAHLIPAASAVSGPPKDVPPPTPLNFPRCIPGSGKRPPQQNSTDAAPQHVCALLQGIIRPTEVTLSHLEALGVRVITDSSIADVIPDPAYIPPFAAWEALSDNDVHITNESTRRSLNTGNLSPGCQAYLDRRKELAISNDAAFRAVRRTPPPKGQTQARLGNSFEFFRHLELCSTFWDDTSQPAAPEPKPEPEAESTSDDTTAGENASLDFRVYRTGAGHQMPPEYRQNIVTAFLKLVAYDYGCNVSAPRVEPRLYLSFNPTTPDAPSVSGPSRNSYFSSGCTFIFRTPRTREAARAGIVEGPLAAISARHSTSFPPPSQPTEDGLDAGLETAPDRESVVDLARELIAALITAQHRARQGKTERRIGEGAWWTTKPRWGGGSGGPIGREVEMAAGRDETVGDKDGPHPSDSELSPAARAPAGASARPSTRGALLPGSSGSDTNSGNKGVKRLKKSGNLPMYDNYRMVRPPAAMWDKKTQYEAIGRKRGANYDDIFVVSSLFHHVSFLRVRVPDRLLEVLDGAPDEESIPSRLSWGSLEVRRSRWYDLFQIDDRVEGMRVAWSMMAYIMRKDEDDEKDHVKAQETVQEDAKMTGV